jgi:CubicO group peptidase (beta-lactamase class C family)
VIENLGNYVFPNMDRDTPNLAIGYMRSKNGQWENNIFKHVIKGSPAGGGYSTIEDLLRFAIALREHRLLSSKYTEIMLTGKVDAPGYSKHQAKYAYGFADERVNNQHRVGHSGTFPGINSQLGMYPELGYVVAVMSNYDPPIADQISDDIAGMLREL